MMLDKMDKSIGGNRSNAPKPLFLIFSPLCCPNTVWG